ncbi:unnamed protein product [Cunninghamella blakesleeana]
MFSKIIDSIRNTNRNIPDTKTERRLSVDDDSNNINNNNNNKNNHHLQPPSLSLSKMHTTGPLPNTTTTHSMDESSHSIPITRRRRSSLFGYSQNSADDYMQKDLVSSSWS